MNVLALLQNRIESARGAWGGGFATPQLAGWGVEDSAPGTLLLIHYPIQLF